MTILMAELLVGEGFEAQPHLLVFAGAFGLQWGMGGLIELLQVAGHSAASAHRDAFAALLVVQASGCLWLFVGGRRRGAG